MPSDVLLTYPPLRWPDKALTMVTWGGAAALFATVGWMAISPRDPQGAVSLVLHPDALMVLQILALAIVVSALATVLVGRKLPDAGTFAVAAGLAVANLQGQTSSYLLIYVTGTDPEARRALAGELAAEGLVWFLVIGAALIVSGLVMRWCFGQGTGGRGGAGAHVSAMAVADLPVLGRWVCPASGQASSAAPARGLLFTGVAAAAAFVLIGLLGTGSPARAVQHGQVYFTVAAAFSVGTWIAYRLIPVQTPLWGCLAIPLVCTMGYVWTMLRPVGPEAYVHVASVPPTPFMRPLPIEYVSVGTAAVVASFWGVARSGKRRRR
jgi:hypothetical protein